MIPRACLINTGFVLFSLIVLTSMPTFGYAKNVYQPENVRVSSVVLETTGQAQVELNANAAFGWPLESSGDRSLFGAGVLHDNLMLLAQKTSKSDGNKPKVEAGKTTDKGSDASKKDDDDDKDEEEDEDEDDDDDDEDEQGEKPAMKEGKDPATRHN